MDFEYLRWHYMQFEKAEYVDTAQNNELELGTLRVLRRDHRQCDLLPVYL
jgi:hypothetical protein